MLVPVNSDKVKDELITIDDAVFSFVGKIRNSHTAILTSESPNSRKQEPVDWKTFTGFGRR